MPSHDDKTHVCRCSAMQWAQAIAIVIGALGTAAMSCIGAIYAVSNNEKATVIESKQDAQVDKAVEVKSTLDRKGRNTEERLKKIEELLYVAPEKRSEIPKSAPPNEKP